MDDGEIFYVLADDDSGLPDPYVLRFILVDARSRGRSSGTIRNKLRGIRLGLEFARSAGIDLEDRIVSGLYMDVDELVRLADRCSLRQDGKGRISGASAQTYYDSFVGYFGFRTDEVVRFANGRQDQIRIKTALSEFTKRAEHKRPSLNQGASANERLGLAPSDRELFLKVIRPGHPRNPFQQGLQLRNHAILLVAYTFGLRSGEEFGLKTKDYVTRTDPPTLTVHRRADDPDETRKDPPLTKTFGRMLPVDGDLRTALDAWVEQRRDRTRYPNARKHPYLFVSRAGNPISLRRARQIYDQLKTIFPGLATVCQHVMRHDANDRWTEDDEKNSIDMVESRKQRTHAFGWSVTSKQPDRYSKASTRRSTDKRMVRMQREAISNKN